MREIKLTQSKVAFVDDEDFDRLNQYRWYAHFDGYNYYACRHLPRVNGRQPSTTMHCDIIGFKKGMEVDHKDGNGLNNQKSNLRMCTHAQNSRNVKPKLNKISSAFKGVSWNREHNKFRARITKDHKVLYLGCFDSDIDAAVAYDNMARKLHGEFKKTNFEAKKLCA